MLSSVTIMHTVGRPAMKELAASKSFHVWGGFSRVRFGLGLMGYWGRACVAAW